MRFRCYLVGIGVNWGAVSVGSKSLKPAIPGETSSDEKSLFTWLSSTILALCFSSELVFLRSHSFTVCCHFPSVVNYSSKHSRIANLSEQLQTWAESDARRLCYVRVFPEILLETLGEVSITVLFYHSMWLRLPGRVYPHAFGSRDIELLNIREIFRFWLSTPG